MPATLTASIGDIVNGNNCYNSISANNESNVTHGTAKPITPPQSAEMRGFHRCLVEYDHKPYSITWNGVGSYPDLTKFPAPNDVVVSPVSQSPEMAAIWRDSDLVDFGSFASIRRTKNTGHDIFPILKLSHPDQQSIELIQYEFNMLAYSSTLGLPVPEFDPHPVMNGTVTCGYRMKELFKMEASEFHSRSEDIKNALRRFHSAGICHGDISRSNIMKDDRQNIVLIDCSFAGHIGSPTPPTIPTWVHLNGIFSAAKDWEALENILSGSLNNLITSRLVVTAPS
ncbi:hypothetical protein F5B17DRAFT_350985 [Nemania serpens]|nr:hypothetical protein F5B17DRAFT_350985 [Nemania serpens]